MKSADAPVVRRSGPTDMQRLEGELKRLKKDVYVNEWKVEQRKVNFEKAKHSSGQKVLSEFMM